MLRELKNKRFKFSLVLADSLYGDSQSNLIDSLEKLKLNYVVAIRSNHGVWMPTHQRIRHNKWLKFDRIFADGKQQVRYIREMERQKWVEKLAKQLTFSYPTLYRFQSPTFLVKYLPSASFLRA